MNLVQTAQTYSEFVARMDDVLDICQWEYDEDCPAICVDEQPTELVKETH